MSIISETGSFGKQCCHTQKNCLLSKSLLVLDMVNEVHARDGKPFLQEAGVQMRVRGQRDLHPEMNRGMSFREPQDYTSLTVPFSLNLTKIATVQLIRLSL